jgi:DNA/RNA non-specific endonuclease
MVAVLGEDAVHFLEGTFDFLMKLAQARSLAAAWKMIIEKADQLIDTVLDGVKSWAISKIVTIAIVKLAALFNPAGAIIQAIQAIYKTISFFIEKAKQLQAIVDAIVKSLSNIAAGRLSDAAGFVEKAMASGMTAIIGFLAEQFGLGDIGKQVRAIIDSVRARVDKALDKIVEYVVAKGKGFYEKGKAAAGKVLAWWQQRKEVLVGDEEHAIYMEGTEEAPRIMIASTPGKPWSEFLKAQPPGKTGALLKTAQKLAEDLEKPLSRSSTPEEKTKNVKIKQDQFNQLADLIVKLGFSQKHIDPASVIKYDENLTPDGGGKEASASILSKQHPKGTPPRDSAPIWKSLGPLVKSRNYVQGHLLNENLGGPGRRFNLTPINKKANANHHAKIEAKVKEVVEAGKVVFYRVHAVYGTHAIKPARFKELKDKEASGLKPTETKELKAYEAEQTLCTSLECDAYELVHDGKQWSKPATPPATQPTIAPAQEHVVIPHDLEP